MLHHSGAKKSLVLFLLSAVLLSHGFMYFSVEALSPSLGTRSNRNPITDDEINSRMEKARNQINGLKSYAKVAEVIGVPYHRFIQFIQKPENEGIGKRFHFSHSVKGRQSTRALVKPPRLSIITETVAQKARITQKHLNSLLEGINNPEQDEQERIRNALAIRQRLDHQLLEVLDFLYPSQQQLDLLFHALSGPGISVELRKNLALAIAQILCNDRNFRVDRNGDQSFHGNHVKPITLSERQLAILINTYDVIHNKLDGDEGSLLLTAIESGYRYNPQLKLANFQIVKLAERAGPLILGLIFIRQPERAVNLLIEGASPFNDEVVRKVNSALSNWTRQSATHADEVKPLGEILENRLLQGENITNIQVGFLFSFFGRERLIEYTRNHPDRMIPILAGMIEGEGANSHQTLAQNVLIELAMADIATGEAALSLSIEERRRLFTLLLEIENSEIRKYLSIIIADSFGYLEPTQEELGDYASRLQAVVGREKTLVSLFQEVTYHYFKGLLETAETLFKARDALRDRIVLSLSLPGSSKIVGLLIQVIREGKHSERDQRVLIDLLGQEIVKKNTSVLSSVYTLWTEGDRKQRLGVLSILNDAQKEVITDVQRRGYTADEFVALINSGSDFSGKHSLDELHILRAI